MSSYSILSEESGGSVVRHRGGQLRRQSSLCFRPFRRALSRTKYAVTNMFNFDRINHKQINILWLSCQLVGTLTNNLGWGSRRMADMPCSSSSQ
jgi:hypothetical protein